MDLDGSCPLKKPFSSKDEELDQKLDYRGEGAINVRIYNIVVCASFGENNGGADCNDRYRAVQAFLWGKA